MNLEILAYEINNTMVFSLIIALGIIYFYAFKKRNEVVNTCMIMKAISNYVQLIVVISFVLLGAIISCYIIKDAQYIALLIPLGWFYISYNIIKRILINDFKISFKEKKKKSKNKSLAMNIVIWVLLSLAFVIGIIFVFTGLKDIYDKFQLSKTYVAVSATVIEIKIEDDIDGALYKPVYQYIVDNKNYTIEPNYSSGIPSKIGSTRIIKYNPLNPKESFMNGTIDSIMILLFGFMFTIIPITFFLFLSNIKRRERIIQYLLPITFLVIGLGTYYFIGYEINSYNPLKIFLVNPLAIIPLIFIIISIMSMCNCIIKKD